MNLKKCLRSKRSQAIAEYIIVFVILCAAIVFVFGGFNPDRLGIKGIFNRAVENAIIQINW